MSGAAPGPGGTTGRTTRGPAAGRGLREGSRGVALALVLLACLGLAIALAQEPPEPSRPADPPPRTEQHRTPDRSSSPTGRFMLGDYGSPLYRTDDTSPPVIDAARTVRALQAAHVNTYAYLICPDKAANPQVSRSQLEQLPEFVRLAGEAGIDVLVYLVPPTEAPEQAYAPFFWDYVGWFDHIGRLAAREPAIKGIVLDDFGGNTVARPSLGFHFTAPYVERMVAAARHHVAALSFLPILYRHDLEGRYAVLSDYRHLIQGVVFPYFGYSDGRTIRGNTWDASKAWSHGLRVSELLTCPRPAGCRQIVFPARSSPSTATDTAGLSSRVVPRPNQRRVVTVQVNDDAEGTAPNSYRVQVVVDGTVVGTANRGLGWRPRAFDITAATANTTSAEVEIRVVRPAGGASRDRITVQLSDVAVTGMTADDGFAQPARTSPDVTSAPISDLPLIFMPYAIPLEAERGRGASPAYFESVFGQMEALREAGRIDGSLVFKLPLAGPVLKAPSTHYEIVARRYAEWSSR